MRYLLDTHTLIWFFEDSPNLPDSVAATIENDSLRKFISVASFWEFTIKHSLGKLDFEGGITELWKMANANAFTILHVKEPYLNILDSLPFLHRDPFDRLLIATAISEDMTVLTKDGNIHQYGVKWAW